MATITVTQSGTVVVGDGDKVIIDIPGGGDVTIIADPTDNVDQVTIVFSGDTEADTVTVDLGTFSEDSLHIDIRDYDPSDTIILDGAFNKYVDPNKVTDFQFDYVGLDGQTYSGFVRAKDGGEKDFTAAESPIIICFAEGTEIETPTGPRKIEALRPGDLVRTLDAGFVAVRWLGCTRVGARDLERWPHLRPVRVPPDAFGPGRPSKEVWLSPNHRVLVTGWRAELFFGEPEILVPAKALVDSGTVCDLPLRDEIAYYHLLLESHQIVETSGLWSESLHLGDQTLMALSETSRRELCQLLTSQEWDRLKKASLVRMAVPVKVAACLVA